MSHLSVPGIRCPRSLGAGSNELGAGGERVSACSSPSSGLGFPRFPGELSFYVRANRNFSPEPNNLGRQGARRVRLCGERPAGSQVTS